MASEMAREARIAFGEEFFMEDEFMKMKGFRIGIDYIQVKCGCTSKIYGDAYGTLRVYCNGKFSISCNCNPDCNGNLTPYEFEKHLEHGGSIDWPAHIWVMMEGNKVPLGKTKLKKFYKHSANGASGLKKRSFHRDEFIQCSKCKKHRRFHLRTENDCRIYHDAALAKESWVCDHRPKPNDQKSSRCTELEERASRISNKGCPVDIRCQGCTACVCFGCAKCRFLDCNCRICVDFMNNAAP